MARAAEPNSCRIWSVFQNPVGINQPGIPSLSRDLVSPGFVQTTRSLDRLGMTTKAVLKRALTASGAG